MNHGHDQHAILALLVENHMAAVLVSAKLGSDRRGMSAHPRIFGEQFEAMLKALWYLTA
jgi:hypothetical protein